MIMADLTSEQHKLYGYRSTKGFFVSESECEKQTIQFDCIYLYFQPTYYTSTSVKEKKMGRTYMFIENFYNLLYKNIHFSYNFGTLRTDKLEYFHRKIRFPLNINLSEMGDRKRFIFIAPT